jgi:hypothetical protein
MLLAPRRDYHVRVDGEYGSVESVSKGRKITVALTRSAGWDSAEGKCPGIERFGDTMRQTFTTGSVPFRKAYLQSLIERIEIDDQHIRIRGSKDVLERAVLAAQSRSESGSQMSTRWRARQDSNL